MPEPISQPVVEIIPPHRTGTGGAPRSAHDPLAKDPVLTWLAGLMDSAFVIPGTSIRFGLDPLIGMIPVAGDVIAGLVSAFIVFRCRALRLPGIVLVRMSMNVVINALVGAIPVVGDVFSVWFRSNERNLDLARAQLANPAKATWRDWAAVLGVAAVVLLSGAAIIWGLIALLQLVGKVFGL
jgi:hypothetical protein